MGGILSFQIGHLVGTTPHCITEVYIERTEKVPLLCKLQIKISWSLDRLTNATFDTRSHHAVKLLSTNIHKKVTIHQSPSE